MRVFEGHSEWCAGGPDGKLLGMNSTPSDTSAPRRLTRSSSDKKLSGVAGGLASYFGVDPLLFRVGFVVATLMSGAGLLAYLGLLVFVPADDADAALRPPSPVTA
jgi:phage shock protein PspC (stress-responsive transcriptional regulator)